MLKPEWHVFRGKKWRVRWRRPRRDKSDIVRKLYPIGVVNLTTDTVTISPHELPWTLLETIVHEGIHACMPDIGEGAVFDTAHDIVALLKATGLKIAFG